MPTTLFRGLTVALAAAVAVGLVSLSVVTLLAMRDVLLDAQQELHRHLARNVLDEMVLDLGEGLAPENLEEQFSRLMVANPGIELYLLDPEGGVVAYSAPGELGRERVSLAPIRRALRAEPGERPRGDDPRNPGETKPFSAAPIVLDGQLRGYLYVILASELYETAVGSLGTRRLLGPSLAVLATSLAAAVGVGALAYLLLVRRLRRLIGRMDRFEAAIASDAEHPEGAPVSGDALARLEATFELLSERTERQLRSIAGTDALRRELVAHVSHDLRTPLAALQGYLETVILMQDGLSRDEVRTYLEAASKHASWVAMLVEELFELARLESPETRPQLETFSLGELVQDVVQKFSLRAAEGGVTLEAARPDAPAFVHADIGLVQRALENLLENALRHTPSPGSVRVALRAEGASQVVEVSDTGRGIPRELLDRVFEPFVRAEAGGGRNIGLGLAIVKRIAELHGSPVTVESTAGVGTTFRFCLPRPDGPETET